MKVKLLDVDLIRTFGGVIVDMSETQAMRYINAGKAKVIEQKPFKRSQVGSKRMSGPDNDKMVWSPPEKKMFESGNCDDGNSIDSPFPGPEDHLFPQID